MLSSRSSLQRAIAIRKELERLAREEMLELPGSGAAAAANHSVISSPNYNPSGLEGQFRLGVRAFSSKGILCTLYALLRFLKQFIRIVPDHGARHDLIKLFSGQN